MVSRKRLFLKSWAYTVHQYVAQEERYISIAVFVAGIVLVFYSFRGRVTYFSCLFVSCTISLLTQWSLRP